MKKLMIVFALTAFVALVDGCKSITVKRLPQTLAKVVQADGSEIAAIDKTGAPIVLDGGWEVEYFQHWNWQKFDTMNATAGAGVTFSLGGYEGGADATNLVALVGTSLSGAAELAAKIGAAIATCGGSACADGVQGLITRFIKAGGNAAAARVTCKDGSCTITDGNVSCDGDGCYECAAGARSE